MVDTMSEENNKWEQTFKLSQQSAKSPYSLETKVSTYEEDEQSADMFA